MAMTERAFVHEEAQSYELRKLRVLDGTAVRARADARRIDAAKLVLGVLAVLVYLLGVTFAEAKISTAGVQINTLKAQIEETRNQAAIADLTIGEKASLSRIEAYASENLGMVYPGADDIYFLDEASSLKLAAAQSAVVVAEEDAAEEEGNSFWQALADVFGNFFHNTALAAD